jgi:tetratricopeptide (TPR) repeat protein
LLGALLVAVAAAAGAAEDAALDAPVQPPGAVATEVDQPSTLDGRRAAAHERLLRLLDEGRAAEAVSAANEVVELTRQIAGGDDERLAVPLMNLASAQLRAGDLPSAEANYLASIRVLENAAGIVAPGLVGPLTGLAQTYLQTRRYPQAVQAYERALRINHVNEGFYGDDQFPIRDGLSEGYLGELDIEKANHHQEAQLAIAERRHGADARGTVAPLAKLGRWYQRTGQVTAARDAFQQAVRAIDDDKASNDPALVEPLLAIAETYRLQGLVPADIRSEEDPQSYFPRSMITLRRALEVVDAQPERDAVQRSKVLAQTGDLYLTWRRIKTAGEHYSLAWRELSDDSHAADRDALLGQPSKLAGPALPTIYPRPKNGEAPPGDSLQKGYVLVRFNVEADGLVAATEIIEAEPAGLVDRQVTSALAKSLFRPVVGAEGPVASVQTVRHEFLYRPGATGPGDDDDDNDSEDRSDEALPMPE